MHRERRASDKEAANSKISAEVSRISEPGYRLRDCRVLPESKLHSLCFSLLRFSLQRGMQRTVICYPEMVCRGIFKIWFFGSLGFSASLQGILRCGIKVPRSSMSPAPRKDER